MRARRVPHVGRLQMRTPAPSGQPQVMALEAEHVAELERPTATNRQDSITTEEECSEVSGSSHYGGTTFAQVAWDEGRRCVLMLVAFALGIAHLYIYPACFGVRTVNTSQVPDDERTYFHHGWTAMLVIFFIEGLTVLLKIWSTWNTKWLAKAVLRKVEGNIGILIGEYIVVALTYIIMGSNLVPVFEEARTGRRVYAVRYMEWTIDACGLVYLDCRILFGMQFAQFRIVLVYTVLYMLLGLWSALADTWLLYGVFLGGSWLFFFLVCYSYWAFLRQNPSPLQQFGRAPIKHAILAFIIIWWILYGVLFMVCFQAPDSVEQWLEQLLWTAMDVVMKLSHTVVLMAWRDTQWQIDAVATRQKAEAEKVIAQLDHQRAIHERDLARLRSRVCGNHTALTAGHERTHGSQKTNSKPGSVEYDDDAEPGSVAHERNAEDSRHYCCDATAVPQVLTAATLQFAAKGQHQDPGTSARHGADTSHQSRDVAEPSSEVLGSSSTEDPLPLQMSGLSAPPSSMTILTKGDASPFAKVNKIFMHEAGLCAVLCVAFAVVLLHLPIYSEYFGVEVLEADSVPDDERGFFHHGWTTMVVVFLIEVITVLLKVWSTWHDPALAFVVAQQLSGNLGVLIAEYLVVGATYVIMGYNLMPVFVVQRPGYAVGRRVYAVRYMEWLVDACGLIWLDCRCLFSRRFREFRMAIFWTIAYMMFGLWSALASTWAWYWVFLLCSWATFCIVCGMLVNFLRQDPYPYQPFGKTLVKPCILAFIIGWWILYGVLFMMCFQASDVVPQWLEQLLWTGMDIIMKVSHTVVLMAWRATEWNIFQIHEKDQAEKSKRRLQKEGSRAQQESQRLEATLMPGLPNSEEDADAAGRERPKTDRPKKEKESVNWSATPGLNLDLSSMIRLEGRLGQGVVTDVHRKGMMKSEDLAELNRLEEAGLLQAQLQQNWESQTREQTFLAHGIRHIAYDPRRWTHTLMTIRGRAPTSFVFWIVLMESAIVLILSKLCDPPFDPGINSGIHAILGSSVAFLIVFRTQTAFKKWWDGRVAASNLVFQSRTFAQQTCAYIKDDDLSSKMVRYTIAAVVATRCHLRNTRIAPEMLLGVLKESEIEELNKEKNMMFYTTWIIRTCLADAVFGGSCLPFHVAIDNALKNLEQAMADAERLLTPMPFTYVVHVRTFLFVYLMGLPFILVGDLGWLMMVAVAFVGYFMIGLENTAVQLENPFGTDCNHHPLDLYCLEVLQDLLHLIDLRAIAKAQGGASLRNRSSAHHSAASFLNGRNDEEQGKHDEDDDGEGD